MNHTSPPFWVEPIENRHELDEDENTVSYHSAPWMVKVGFSTFRYQRGVGSRGMFACKQTLDVVHKPTTCLQEWRKRMNEV